MGFAWCLGAVGIKERRGCQLAQELACEGLQQWTCLGRESLQELLCEALRGILRHGGEHLSQFRGMCLESLADGTALVSTSADSRSRWSASFRWHGDLIAKRCSRLPKHDVGIN
ncbi:hypothetical protein CN97_19420 [Haematobacter massiliensis]|uniref:Uncharacterized protein n=1 Tax=Haematobacter massiliensis TaxID=195105 RepID=A0A086Y2E9_9RHOB|nr:hypothetical protein CN97_19420 [Haematobacter massiliensis]OWJ84632.1 hypothetical protein CDV51_13160 [Haematobacter massiliensis]